MRKLFLLMILFTATSVAFASQRPIIIDNSGNTNALNDQIKIQLNADNFDFSHAATDASDIYFTSKSSASLNFYIESYSQCAKLGTIWVKVNCISSASIDTIYINYGVVCSHATSSFAGTMQRFQTTEDSAKYVVRFNNGSGTTATNIGSIGGSLNLVGGYTWNTTDTYGESTGSLTLNGTTGYAEKAGLMDDWGTEGHIKIRFKWIGSNSPALWSKHNRLATSASDLGDFIDLQIAATLKLQLQFFVGSSSKLTISGKTIFEKGKTYEVSFVYNTYQVFLYVNGQMDASYYSRTAILPPTGSATPFRIGCSSDNTTGNPALFLNGQLNDFVYQKFQPYKSKIISLHENRSYFQKDEMSKWNISRVSEFGGGGVDAISETSLIFDGSKFIVYYSRTTVAGSNTVRLFRRTANTFEPNTNNSWSSEIQVLPGYCRTHTMHVFGGVYYCYYRNAVAAGPVILSTSADGITFTGASTILAQPTSGAGSLGFYNPAVIYDPIANIYRMSISDVDPILTYAICTASGTSSPSGTFTLECLNPKYSMVDGFSFGAPCLNRINGVYHEWMNGNGANKATGSILPTEMYRATSTDFINWSQKYGDEPWLIRERPNEYDQASDCYIMEANGNSYMTYLQGTNVGGYKGYMNIGKFNGTLVQLVTDITYQIGAEF